MHDKYYATIGLKLHNLKPNPNPWNLVVKTGPPVTTILGECSYQFWFFCVFSFYMSYKPVLNRQTKRQTSNTC